MTTTERTMDRPDTRDNHGNGEATRDVHAGHEEIPKNLPRPSNATVIVVLGVFVLLLVALFFVGYIPHRHRVAEADADAAERASGVPVVQVELPKKSAPTSDLLLPCDIRANQETAIYPRSSGYLKKWYVDIQDKVQAGQLLAEIDAPEVDAQLAQSRAQLEQSKANVVRANSDLDLAQKNLDRFEEANKNSPGSVTQQQLDQMRAAVENTRSALEQAKASVASSDADVQRLSVLQNFERVTAPFAGIITSRNYDVGALLNPSDTGAGRQMFSIAQIDALRVFVNVPQAESTEVKVGQPVFLKVRNYPDREFAGEVARTAGSIDPATRTMTVELHFPNKDLALVPGMYGQVRLPLHEAAPTLTIPTSALVFNADGLRADVVRDGKIHEQKLQVGRDFGTEIEVSSGLSDQDEVVTNPGEKLSEGVEVKTFEPKQAAPNTRVAHAN
ncbi:MAG TPA: efflux RND transporter periplasmic adaptor subunit [Tepidisphaeraceae bacterium]|nr:efflux RND transporter periplasmic adaptor subunit [Tepidisphaeraceae bacterium]